ncbi:MAG: FecR domain-containing protein [Acidobacteria bacterium]|nr:FecR domain-containing protein [Acidobacteriota bacterium]
MLSRNYRVFFHLCAAVFFMTSLLFEGASAQQLGSARITAIEGQVEIRRYPSTQPVPVKIAFKVDDRLSAGDTIITGKNGKLVLGLTDGSQAVIAPKSTVVIKDLSESPRTLFEVIKGKTRVHIEKLGGQPNPYRVNTPTAVIAVRGTIFDVLVDDNETQVFLHEGEVAVTNLRLPNQPIILSAGQMTRIQMLGPPRPPGTFKPGRNDGNFRTAQTGRQGQDNGRIADSSRRGSEGPNRSGQRSDGNDRREPGRGTPPAIGGSQPEIGRGGPPPGGAKPKGKP